MPFTSRVYASGIAVEHVEIRLVRSTILQEEKSMCPACLTTTALAIAGAASAGSLSALIMKKLRRWVDAQIAVESQQQGT